MGSGRVGLETDPFRKPISIENGIDHPFIHLDADRILYTVLKHTVKFDEPLSRRLKHTLCLTHSVSSMTSLIQDVFSLRNTLRDPTAPAAVLASIDTIRHSIASSAEQNGWKTVDWRGGGKAAPSRNRSYAPHRDQNSFRSRVQETPASIPLVSTTAALSMSATVAAAPHKHHTWHESPDGFRHPPPKYVSKFKKSSEKVEDTILNTILLGKLNKFSQPNYNEIKEFITHIIASGQTEMIKCFMKLVFEKAASEEVFCPLYAKLLSELSIQYPVLLTEMANLYTQYMEIFDEIEEDTTSETYTELCKRNVEKKYRRGYSQFLAELIKHDVIDAETFMKSITKIISQVEANQARSDYVKLNEEYADCLMKIMKAICSDVSEEDDSEQKIQVIRTTLKGDVAARIEPLSARNAVAVGLSNKARFTLLDIYEKIQKF